MPDADRPRMSTAETPAEVCEAVARWDWWDKHRAECPAHRIPKPAELAEWLPECPADIRDEAAELLAALYPAGATWERITIGGPATVGGDDPERWTREGRPHLCAFIRAPEPQPGMLAVPDGRGGWAAVVTADIQDAHRAWSALPDPRPRHPLAPVVDAWQRRAPDLRGAIVTATRNRDPMTRRPVLVSTTLRTPWIAAVNVDGEPLTAQVPDPGAVFDAWNKPVRRQRYHADPLQRELRLPGVPPAPHDLRLAALAALDPRHGLIDDATPALAGDVLTLLAYSHAIDRPMVLTERDGAALLARTRTGLFRSPQESDVERFRLASAYLRSLTVWDPLGTSRWLDLANVSAARDRVDGGWSVEIGPPAWARPIEGKWTLTAEGSTAARLRPTAGEGSMAGRIVTGIEYRLAARHDGRRGSIAPDLRPQNGRAAGPGRQVALSWRDVLRLAGDYWDPNDQRKDKAALERFNRAVAWLERVGYWASHPRAEAQAGDSVEVLNRTRGSRARPATLIVRATARFVEAARKAQQRDGAGFESIRLTDYAGLSDPE